MGVRSNCAGVLEAVVERLPPGWRPLAGAEVEHLYSLRVGGARARAGTRAFHLLYAGLRRAARTENLDEALEALESEVALTVGALSPERVFLHAGVVGWQGQAIVLPGRSFAGKSTLVAALVRAGATYYSDEYAVLDDEGWVHPYPRPLSLREAEGRRRCGVEELGGKRGAEPLPVGLVALCRYQPGGRWRPRRLTAGRAVFAMLADAVPARVQPERVLQTLHRVATRAAVVTSARGEAAETVGALASELEKGIER